MTLAKIAKNHLKQNIVFVSSAKASVKKCGQLLRCRKKAINNLLNGGMSNNEMCPNRQKNIFLHQNDLEFEECKQFSFQTITMF